MPFTKPLHLTLIALASVGLIACSEEHTVRTIGAAGNNFSLCAEKVTLANSKGEACLLRGTITADTVLSSDNVYLIRDKVTIGRAVNKDGTQGDGVMTTLTVRAGVTILGEVLNSNPSFLVIARGSRIEAMGTQENPIRFTSRAAYENDRTASRTETTTSEWGGIAINGLAGLSCGVAQICESDGEGTSGKYGGNDDNDDSGTLEYVRIEYAGFPFSGNDELNAIALQGVGRGTTIENLQIHNGADDGIEFFGGTVNVKNLIVTGADDDYIDWTEGYRGAIQYGLIVSNPNLSNSDYGIEGEHNAGDDNQTRPIISNVTFVNGETTPPASGKGAVAIQFKKLSSGVFINNVVKGWNTCLDIDDSGIAALSGADALIVKSNLFDCAIDVKTARGAGTTRGTALIDNSHANGGNNSTAAATLGSLYINGATESGIAVTDASAFNASGSTFLTDPDKIGAVKDSSSDWTDGWSVALD